MTSPSTAPPPALARAGRTRVGPGRRRLPYRCLDGAVGCGFGRHARRLWFRFDNDGRRFFRPVPSFFQLLPSGLFNPAFIAPGFGLRRRKRRSPNRVPIELDAGILRFKPSPHLFVEWFAADSDVRRRAVPVEDAVLQLAAPVGDGMDEGHVLVAALVAGESQIRHEITCASDPGPCPRTWRDAPILRAASFSQAPARVCDARRRRPAVALAPARVSRGFDERG